MGTNYYAIPKATDDLKLKIIQAVINNEMDRLKGLIPHQIHIGKSSSGWPFLFNHNDWEYYKSFDELKTFLNGCEITDEYGRPESAEELLTFIEQKQKIGVDKFTEGQYGDCYIIKDGYAFTSPGFS